jgi:prepilin-type N-terminal cleavage/methylation domain-containing protein
MNISRKNNLESGFTLIELVIVVVVIGIISIILSPTFNALTQSQKGAYNAKQLVNNQLINSALLNYSRYSSLLGSLPAPYTQTGTATNAIYNPASVTAPGLALTTALTQSGLNAREINDDGYSSHRVRVYQLVSGLTQQVPLSFQSGPLATLTYQYGAVYQSQCESANTTCNPTVATGIPGSSPVMTSANYTTWTTSGSDGVPIFVTSLPLQKQMLDSTAKRLDKVRDVLVGYLRAQQSQAAATDTTNWYPSESTSLGGASPGGNQGCRDGWYNLLTGTVVLATVGLGPSEFGTTAWGGVIQYCRDYDPLGTKVANAAPHYGALRFNKNVSLASPPDTVTVANNIVLTF